MTPVCKDYLDLLARHGDAIVDLSNRGALPASEVGRSLPELLSRHIARRGRDGLIRLTSLGRLMARAIERLETATDKMAHTEDLLRARDEEQPDV